MTARDDGGGNGAGDAERWVQADAAETSAQRRPAWQFDVYDQNINKTPAEEGKLSCAGYPAGAAPWGPACDQCERCAANRQVLSTQSGTVTSQAQLLTTPAALQLLGPRMAAAAGAGGLSLSQPLQLVGQAGQPLYTTCTPQQLHSVLLQAQQAQSAAASQQAQQAATAQLQKQAAASMAQQQAGAQLALGPATSAGSTGSSSTPPALLSQLPSRGQGSVQALPLRGPPVPPASSNQSKPSQSKQLDQSEKRASTSPKKTDSSTVEKSKSQSSHPVPQAIAIGQPSSAKPSAIQQPASQPQPSALSVLPTSQPSQRQIPTPGPQSRLTPPPAQPQRPQSLPPPVSTSAMISQQAPPRVPSPKQNGVTETTAAQEKVDDAMKSPEPPKEDPVTSHSSELPLALNKPPTEKQQPQRAVVKPQILTHLIDGFIIQEGPQPFPIKHNSILVESRRPQAGSAKDQPEAGPSSENGSTLLIQSPDGKQPAKKPKKPQDKTLLSVSSVARWITSTGSVDPKGSAPWLVPSATTSAAPSGWACSRPNSPADTSPRRNGSGNRPRGSPRQGAKCRRRDCTALLCPQKRRTCRCRSRWTSALPTSSCLPAPRWHRHPGSSTDTTASAAQTPSWTWDLPTPTLPGGAWR
ncbi:zinc ion binding, partial [Branchiostoma belcheri]